MMIQLFIFQSITQQSQLFENGNELIIIEIEKCLTHSIKEYISHFCFRTNTTNSFIYCYNDATNTYDAISEMILINSQSIYYSVSYSISSYNEILKTVYDFGPFHNNWAKIFAKSKTSISQGRSVAIYYQSSQLIYSLTSISPINIIVFSQIYGSSGSI